jgi:glutamate synthase (NADPH/NADH) small chain
MDYLVQSNRVCNGEEIEAGERISAKGRNTVIIGGGDTGADCLGTALRQGALRVHQPTHGIRPPEDRPADTPWPEWPRIPRFDSSHEEGGERSWGIKILEFLGTDGHLVGLKALRVGPPPDYLPKPDGEFTLEVELALIAIGFSGPSTRLIESCGIELTDGGQIKTDPNLKTAAGNVFAAGDSRIGASLVVNAIADGRKAAESVHSLLSSQP